MFVIYLERAEDTPARRVFTVDDVSTGVLVELAKSTPKGVHVPQHLKSARQQKTRPIKYHSVRDTTAIIVGARVKDVPRVAFDLYNGTYNSWNVLTFTSRDKGPASSLYGENTTSFMHRIT